MLTRQKLDAVAFLHDATDLIRAHLNRHHGSVLLLEQEAQHSLTALLYTLDAPGCPLHRDDGLTRPRGCPRPCNAGLGSAETLWPLRDWELGSAGEQSSSS
jgi:hypothetical protein